MTGAECGATYAVLLGGALFAVLLAKALFSEPRDTPFNGG